MEIKLFIIRNNSLGACPGCGEKATLDRMKPYNFVEKYYLIFLKHKKYHCRICKWDGNLPSLKINPKFRTVLLNYILILIASAVVIIAAYFLLRKFLR